MCFVKCNDDTNDTAIVKDLKNNSVVMIAYNLCLRLIKNALNKNLGNLERSDALIESLVCFLSPNTFETAKKRRDKLP